MVSSSTVSKIASATVKAVSSTITSKAVTTVVSSTTSKITSTTTSAAAQATAAVGCKVIKQVTFCKNNITQVFYDGVVRPQAECTLDKCSLFIARWGYLPNIPANALFMAIFAIITIASIPLGFWKKTWGVLAGVFLGGLLETIGTLGRIQAASNPFTFNPFLIYIIALTIGPSFLSAAIYLCLARIIVVYGENNARFKPRTYSLAFMFSDFVALVLQGGGGGIAATAKDDMSKAQTGTNVMLAGLVWQVVSLTLFAVAAWDFSRTYKQGRFPAPQIFNELRRSRRWKGFSWSLAAATGLIYVRSVYRVAELTEGFSGHIADLEVPYMLFEPVMIALACFCLLVWHPSYVFGDLWEEADYRKKKDSDSTLEWGSENEKSEIKEKKSLNLAVKIFRPRKRGTSIKRWSNPHVHKADCPNHASNSRNGSLAGQVPIPPTGPARYETNLNRAPNADWDTNARTPLLTTTAYKHEPCHGSNGSISHHNPQVPHSASFPRRPSDRSEYSIGGEERDVHFGGARTALPNMGTFRAVNYGTSNSGNNNNNNDTTRRASQRDVSPRWTSAHQQPGGLYPMSARAGSTSERDAERWVAAHQAAYPRTATLAPRTPFVKGGGEKGW